MRIGHGEVIIYIDGPVTRYPQIPAQNRAHHTKQYKIPYLVGMQSKSWNQVSALIHLTFNPLKIPQFQQ